MSGATFARELLIKATTLASYEHGRVPLKCEFVWRMNFYFPINPHWLATGEGSPFSVETLPVFESVGVQPEDRFTVAWSKIAGDFAKIQGKGQFADTMRERFSYESVFSVAMTQWLCQVPDNSLPTFADALLASGRRLVAEYGPLDTIATDAREAAFRTRRKAEHLPAYRRFVLEQIAESVGRQVAKESRPREKTSNEAFTSDALQPTKAPVQPILPTLIERLRRATGERGRKTELAAWLGVPRQSLNDWMSARKEPSGETTLRLLNWVTAEEAKSKTKSPASVSAPAGPQTQPGEIGVAPRGAHGENAPP